MNLFFSSIALVFLSFSLQAGLKVGTYNLGLARGWTPLAEKRLPHLLNAIEKSNIDTFCIQEAWYEDDRKKILEALKKKYPHQYFNKIKTKRAVKSPVCGLWDIIGEDRLISCMVGNCMGKSASERTRCILTTCDKGLRYLTKNKRECALALMANTGKGSLSTLFKVLNPFKKTGLFTYNGSDGLMILSKYPLKNRKFLDLESISTTTHRGALIADLDYKGKLHRIMCTHLTPDLSSVPYAGPFSGWREENKVQLQLLIGESKKTTLPTIMMGDFNCGLEDNGAGISAKLPESCSMAVSEENFVDSLAENQPECTFCSSNTLIKDDRDKNYLIDHIYTRDLKVISQAVVFKDMVTLETENRKETTHLSDHFGILIELE